MCWHEQHEPIAWSGEKRRGTQEIFWIDAGRGVGFMLGAAHHRSGLSIHTRQERSLHTVVPLRNQKVFPKNWGLHGDAITS